MNRHGLRRLTATLFVGAVALTPARAQSHVASEDLVTTHHQVVLADKTLVYTATAGRLPIINNDAGEPHGNIFFVAYSLQRQKNQAVRPLTFVWNGGPGSSASQVHLIGFGPKRLKMGDTYPTSTPLTAKTTFEDNQETWLDFTDLVFVDPIGTGYSRPTKPEYAAEFFNTVGDAESVAEFIRVYRMRFDAYDAPLFLAGESYGTTRAQWVSEALERRRTPVAGVALISGPIALGQNMPQTMSNALLVPKFTATAYYFKKLPTDLQSGTLDSAIRQAADWARATYATALARRDSLTPAQRETIVEQLMRFSGARRSMIDSTSLTISSNNFTDHLLEDQGLDLGRYDSRMTARRNIATTPWTTAIDPSLRPVLDLMQGTSPSLIRYLRFELQYKTDLVYSGPFGGAYPAPAAVDGDWMANRWARGNQPAGVPAFAQAAPSGAARGATAAPIPLVPPLRKAMEVNPSMRVLVVQGLYDGFAGCEGTAYAVSLVEPAAVRSRVTTKCYTGGHMMYTDRDARRDMKRDMRELVRAGVVASSSPQH